MIDGSTPSNGTTGPGSLIIVEDEFVIALSTQVALETLGYRVCGIAKTAAEAVALAERHRPDLALVDLRLADGSNGLTAAATMMERFAIPSIIVSAQIDEADAGRSGVLGMLKKPVLPEQLAAVLTVALGRCNNSPVAAESPASEFDPPDRTAAGGL